jgi:hypothetical protein
MAGAAILAPAAANGIKGTASLAIDLLFDSVTMSVIFI